MVMFDGLCQATIKVAAFVLVGIGLSSSNITSCSGKRRVSKVMVVVVVVVVGVVEDCSERRLKMFSLQSMVVKEVRKLLIVHGN